MQTIPTEIFNIICNGLTQYECLIVSSCAKESKHFSCHINREKQKKEIAFVKSKIYIVPSKINSIFGTIEDVNDMKEDFYNMTKIDKRDCIFGFMNYFINALLNNVKYPYFENNPYITQLKYLYFVRKIGTSLFRWGLPDDKSEILQNMQKSIIYNVRAPSHQYSKILHSKTLKALVG